MLKKNLRTMGISMFLIRTEIMNLSLHYVQRNYILSTVFGRQYYRIEVLRRDQVRGNEKQKQSTLQNQTQIRI